jgi:hypothetical protein
MPRERPPRPEPDRLPYAKYVADPSAAWQRAVDGIDVVVELDDGRTFLLAACVDVPDWDDGL